jgi:hypothetical protein
MGGFPKKPIDFRLWAHLRAAIRKSKRTKSIRDPLRPFTRDEVLDARINAQLDAQAEHEDQQE